MTVKTSFLFRSCRCWPLTASSVALSLILSLAATSLHAKGISPAGLSLDQAYLAHWFAYDSAEPIKLERSLLKTDDIGHIDKLRFTSDDGQTVNGMIAYGKHPNTAGRQANGGVNTAVKKLALLLHPMGSDQTFWWRDDSPLGAHALAQHLRQQGYTVISLDARRHGERGTPAFGPRELLARAHSPQPRLYIDTIVGSVRDYRILLNWAHSEFHPTHVLAMGYSMGAQMSLLLASYESRVSAVVAMVPPYVKAATSPVAPRVHMHRVSDAKVLWLAGRNDPHSNQKQTQDTFAQIESADKELVWYDAGHRLPPEFLARVTLFINSLNVGVVDEAAVDAAVGVRGR